MLAKMWKKVLLAVCIIACIFNIMTKLVNRHSLESNLERANDGNTVLDSIVENDNTLEENSVNNTVMMNETNTESQVEGNQDSVTSNEQVQTKDKNQDAIDRYTDYIITF